MGIPEEPIDFTGSTDVGNVSQIVPAIHPVLRIMEGDCSLHTPQFREATLQPMAMGRLVDGAKLLALTGLRVLEDAEFRKKAWEELSGKR